VTTDRIASMGLAGEDLEALAGDPRVAMVVDDELVIRWVNHPLMEWGPGRSLLDAVHGPERRFYAGFFQAAMTAKDPVDHDYACPTPERFRRFRLRAYPLNGPGLLVVHSLVDDGPAPGPTSPAAVHVDGHGIAHVCGHCRRTRRNDGSGTWDWVPAFVERSVENVSHGLCSACVAYHFPADSA
jgi:hypothetical protein